jgi:transposase
MHDVPWGLGGTWLDVVKRPFHSPLSLPEHRDALATDERICPLCELPAKEHDVAREVHTRNGSTEGVRQPAPYLRCRRDAVNPALR